MQLRKSGLLLGAAGAMLVPLAAYAVTFTGNVTFSHDLNVTGALSKGSGSFVIDHPLDPKNKLLYHSFVESPDVKNLYDGIATLNKNGEAVIELPAYFEVLNMQFRYAFFPIGAPMPNLYVKEKIETNRFVISGGLPGGEISWQVTGIRQDPFIRANPIVPEVDKGPDKIFDKGQCIFPPLCD